MDNTIRVFSGRAFSPEYIKMIKWARKTYLKLFRCEFACTVCELVDWTAPVGRLEKVQCAVFLKMEPEGIIQLLP